MKLDLRKKPTASTEVQNSGGGPAVKKKIKLPGGKKGIALVLVCAIGGVVLWQFFGGNEASAANTDPTYTLAAVECRDLTATITGSGTLEAANAYSVTTLLEGTILTADFEEGDTVEQGTVLYTIDSSELSSTLEQAEISLSQAQRNYNNKLKDQKDLTVTTTISGRVLSLEVEVGDEVTAGQTIATIRNYNDMSLTVPFPADDAAGFYLGQSAAVTLDSTFETLTGRIGKISANETVLSGNVIVRYVTIDVSNPGGLSTGQAGTAEINGVTSSSSGSFTYMDEAVITAKTSGTVSRLSVAEGDWVNKNQGLVTLSSDTLGDEIQSASESVRNAELSLENRYDQMEDYAITSPIEGTIIDKNYKAGETTEANQVLCTIYDLSYLTMTLSVDELDISDIEVGQTVSIVADAVEDRIYEGIVTKVSVAGTSSSGVTTYPVTIRIDESDGLMPGMNVDATITLDSASDVLAIPSAALQRGNTVLVTADSPSAANAGSTQLPEGSGAMEQTNGRQTAGEYVSVAVAVGVSDGSYSEIISGLQEGDTVVYIPTTSSSGDTFVMMGGMPTGGMQTGGMVSGVRGG